MLQNAGVRNAGRQRDAPVPSEDQQFIVKDYIDKIWTQSKRLLARLRYLGIPSLFNTAYLNDKSVFR